mgnify:CR=1 FL=1
MASAINDAISALDITIATVTYVSTRMNPADAPSRGLHISERDILDLHLAVTDPITRLTSVGVCKNSRRGW